MGIEPRSAALKVDALPPGQRGGERERGRERNFELLSVVTLKAVLWLNHLVGRIMVTIQVSNIGLNPELLRGRERNFELLSVVTLKAVLWLKHLVGKIVVTIQLDNIGLNPELFISDYPIHCFCCYLL